VKIHYHSHHFFFNVRIARIHRTLLNSRFRIHQKKETIKPKKRNQKYKIQKKRNQKEQKPKKNLKMKAENFNKMHKNPIKFYKNQKKTYFPFSKIIFF
jgi:hypothetical protein